MTLSLEDRLAAAGEQLDALIELEQPVLLRVAERPGREPRSVAMLVSLCTVILVVVGLVWATRPDAPTRVPGAETSTPQPTASVPSTPPVTTPTSEPSSSSVPAATIPPVGSTTIPFDERPPVAIGESVMKGAVPQLVAGGFELFVEESLQGNDIADAIEQLRAAGQVGRVVVIQAGTNGPVSADVYRRIADALVEADQVVFLTVHADRAWIPGNNAIIWSLPAEYPNVTVLDWDGLVSSGVIPGMAADGIHLGTPSAQQSYANYVFSTIGRTDLVRPIEDGTRVVDISGPWPTYDPSDAETTPYLLPEVELPGMTMQRRSEGSFDDVTIDRYDQWFVSPDGTAVLRISTTAAPATLAPSGPLTIGEWNATVRPMAPGFAALDLTSESGTVLLWATGIDERALEGLAATLSRPPSGQPGWDATALPNGVRQWTQGWYRPDQARSLQWVDANGERRAELREGCCVFEGLGWLEDPVPVIYDGTLVVTQSTPGLIEAAWVHTDDGGEATPMLLRIVDGDLADVSAIVRSMRAVTDVEWQAVTPEPPSQDDGCSSLFC